MSSSSHRTVTYVVKAVPYVTVFSCEQNIGDVSFSFKPIKMHQSERIPSVRRLFRGFIKTSDLKGSGVDRVCSEVLLKPRILRGLGWTGFVVCCVCCCCFKTHVYYVAVHICPRSCKRNVLRPRSCKRNVLHPRSCKCIYIYITK